MNATRVIMVALLAWSAHSQAVRGVDPVTQQFMVDVDTRIDSRDPTYNFGVSTTAKVVVNGMDGSLVRSLFRLPEGLPDVPAARVVSAKVWFYVWFDQTGTRTARLHPLTRAFAEGTGDATPADDGASWWTSDGETAWTTAGGDYDAAVFVDAVETTNWFSWDISGLWDDANLRAFGAILRMDDEADPGYPNMPRAPFTSSDGPTSQWPYVEVTYLPVVTLDLDGDGDVDLADFATFQECFTGLGGPPIASGCADADADGDEDVDSEDYAAFESGFTGPANP
jgi:hypothetical protein